MPPVRMTRVEQQAQTRERLLSAAERIIARHGYGGSSIDLIAAEAGYSKGAIYSNFDSKEAIFLELLRRYTDRDMADLAVLMHLDADQVPAALTAWLDVVSGDDDCTLLAAELQLHARRSPDFAAQYYAQQRRNTETLAGLLERYFAVSKAAMPMPAIDLADTLMAITHGVSLQHPMPTRGTAGAAGKVVDTLLKYFVRPQRHDHAMGDASAGS